MTAQWQPIECRNCRWWFPHPIQPGFGICRRRAPIYGHGDRGMWPNTHERESCGDIEPIQAMETKAT